MALDQGVEAPSLAAVDSGTTLNRLVENALRESLARREMAGKRERVTLPTFKGKGIRPGVDINDSAGLLDLMDEWDASHRR